MLEYEQQGREKGLLLWRQGREKGLLLWRQGREKGSAVMETQEGSVWKENE